MNIKECADERGPYLTVTDRRGTNFLLDVEDLNILRGYEWLAYKSRYTHYVRRARASNILLHRVILNAQPGFEVDHINGDGLNCRRYNMRLVTRGQNLAHKIRQVTRRSATGYRRVYETANGRFVVIITANRKCTYHGTFDDPIEAAKVGDRAALAAFGEFAILNFPPETP